MIIGITGTLGAGKGTVVEYLKTKGFKHYSVSSFISEEIVRRGLSVNRDTLTEVGTDLRKIHGPDYISTELLKRAAQEGGNSIIESLRAVGEVENMKKHGAAVWAVDADIKSRYGRIAKRKSEKDFISFEKFVADEARESKGVNPHEMNLPKCIALADAVFQNNGTEAELFAQVEKALKNKGTLPADRQVD